MSKYVCSSCELVQEAGKNPYLRVSFQKKAASGIMQDSGKPVVLAMSGSFFNGTQPDHAKNLAWCQARKDSYVGQEADIDEFIVDVEPYYRKVNEGKDLERDSTGNPIAYDKITVRAFSETDLATGVVSPYNGWDSVKRQGARMLKNGAQLYITVAKYQQFIAAKQAIAQPTATAAQSQQQGLMADVSSATILPM